VLRAGAEHQRQRPKRVTSRRSAAAGWPAGSTAAYRSLPPAPRRVGPAIRTALEWLSDGTIELEPTRHHGLAAAAGIHDRLADATGTNKHVVLV
jgi:hypothetical protein